MNVLKKAEKSLEYLKNYEGLSKGHELQAVAGTLGRCLGALGTRPNYARHYSNLLSSAIPILLKLSSHESAEVRLVGDEALNRIVVGGFAFNSYKTNAIFLNQIDVTKNARWIRATLSRICLRDCWLRPGIGKIRSQAQSLFPKLSQIVRQTNEVPLIIGALENNLPRILKALAEYTTDEEISELTKALLSHIEVTEASIRRGIGTCIAHLVSHREPLLTNILEKVFENLWPSERNDAIVIGWFCVIKAILQINDFEKLYENDLFSVQDYLEIYQLCIHYIETTEQHNIQNAVLECLSVLLSRATNYHRRGLLDKHPSAVCLDSRKGKGHRRNFSYSSAVSCRTINSIGLEWREPELALSGALQLGSVQRLNESPLVDDLDIQTPDSQNSDNGLQLDTEQLAKEVSQRLQEYEDVVDDADQDVVAKDVDFKINIGSCTDDDVILKYCARLIVSKFLLAGCKGSVISDRSVRVSVKASALSCLSFILQMYPQALTIYLDKEADNKLNLSGSSEGTESNRDNIHEYILERNVCYQDSITESLCQDLLKSCHGLLINKKDSKSLEKSLDSELKSSKDVPSNILDSKSIADSNMTNSNFTAYTDEQGCPMSISGDVSIDLDMKFDHFGESNDGKKERVDVKVIDEVEDSQHMSDLLLFEGHNDPQVRGLVRVCLANYLIGALDSAHGDYSRWRYYSLLPKEEASVIAVEKLVDVLLKGLSDEIHSAVNHTLSALTQLLRTLSYSVHWNLLEDILNALVAVEKNKYWLCRVNLIKLYEKLPFQRLFMLSREYLRRSSQVMSTLYSLLADQDQKVRAAAALAITNIIPVIFPPPRSSPITMLAETAAQTSDVFSFNDDKLSVELVRDMFFYHDLPEQMTRGDVLRESDNLLLIVGELVGNIMASKCEYLTQGSLEALQAVCRRWSPWKHPAAYSTQGILSYCLSSLECCNTSVVVRTTLLDLCHMVYPVEIKNIMQSKKNRDMFDADLSEPREKWHHLESETVASLAEKFQQVTLKMLNLLVHLIEEINPNVHLNTSGIPIPGSSEWWKTHDSTSRDADDKIPKKKLNEPGNSLLRANYVGHFYTEPIYMKLYDNLRATYSNYKINLESKSSIFYGFLSTVLNSLAIQLELSTEREFGPITEEILYYLKTIMPLCPDKTVYSVTQLLKCLFGTNMINQYADYMSIDRGTIRHTEKDFFNDVMLVNCFEHVIEDTRMIKERDYLMAMESFQKNRSDRKWSNNKRELERYIRLFEPVVIQSLNTYTLQNDTALQCEVLKLLCQLLALRVNYCMLDSDQVFIGFLIKQLDLVEQHEIPNCCGLVNSIMLFLVQLSTSKHHTKQIIEIPKLIQLCDGLMASGALDECIAGLEPVAIKVFSSMGGVSVLGRAQQQELQATREVLFYMLQKTMHQAKVQELVSCVLTLSQEHPESYYRWSELACDTLLNLLSERSIECDSADGLGVRALESLLDCVYRDVLLEQCRIELILKILFKAPPEQVSTPRKQKLRYLIIIMVLLRKVLILIPESEILLSINELKATAIAPQTIFFNVKTNVDPLNVQSVNENCANLSPDVVLVRFLFKTLTYAIGEMDSGSFDFDANRDRGPDSLLYAVCVNIIVQVKHMLHLTNGCHFPLTAKTAQTILHNEQSGLNTGLYAPEENIPLDRLNLVCLTHAHRLPLITAHWSHLLIRMNFLSHKYWQKLIGFSRNLPLSGDSSDTTLLRVDLLQTACVMAYCEYFVDNGLTEVIHLTWLLANRVHILVSQYGLKVVQQVISKVQQMSGSSALLLHAIAARCQTYLKDEFALNAYKILSLCHESQSGALVFFVCRVVGKLEPSVACKFVNLAMDRCEMLRELPADKINSQLTKEDVQVALEMLQRENVHMRYPKLVVEVNSLAISAFDLSPLDLTADRLVSPQHVITTKVDDHWRITQLKTRCCQHNIRIPKVPKHSDLAQLLSKLSLEELTTVMSCPEFDRKIINKCFNVACEHFTKEFFNVLSVHETKENERQFIKDQREMCRLKDEMTSSDHKINVVNIHVFKKSDSKESKSQFFIPINNDVKENFGNLKICEEDCEIVVPELPKLYIASVSNLDRYLAEILKLFPKQNRPLSQSDNFNLNTATLDRYTRKCHQVFQDKLFYQEFLTLQTILTGFLTSLDRIITLIDETDCELLEKNIENLMPGKLAKNLANFSVMSLQYLSFLIKNKKLVESPINVEVSFRVSNGPIENVSIDHVMGLTIDNVEKALKIDEILRELNVESNLNRVQSAVCCLFAVVKYLVKDTKPIVAKSYINSKDESPKLDIMITGDKLISLIEYWEINFYVNRCNVLSKRYRKSIEGLIVSLSRLEVFSNIALIPPIAWSCVDVNFKKEQKDHMQRIDLPLQALQDMDVLEPFLFRVNLIGWSSKKQFEEIWVGLLGALQGNGPHWAIRGISQLLISTAPRVRGKGLLHVPRRYLPLSDGMQRLRTLLVGTSAWRMFDDINLEHIPFVNEGITGYQYDQFSTEYLKYSAEVVEDAHYRVRREVRRVRSCREIDVNSCLQLVMDMLEAPTGLAARVALLSGISIISSVFTSVSHWARAGTQLMAASHATTAHWPHATTAALHALAKCLPVLQACDGEGLQDLSSVHEKLLKSLSSSYAPLRQAALRGWLLQLSTKMSPNSSATLRQIVIQQLSGNKRISLYEQCLFWTVLFTMLEMEASSELASVAVTALLNRPGDYCADVVQEGIKSILRQQILPKDLKKNIIEKLLENMSQYSENHAIQILMVHLFSADNKLLSPKLTPDVSNMDPDVLMNSMERLTLLYKTLRLTKSAENKRIVTNAIKYFLRETLPPTATLSRVVIEYVESIRECEKLEGGACERDRYIENAVCNCEVVFEVFETSISQDQLQVLTGWIFEALCHLLTGISPKILPYCVLTLLVSSSSNRYIRSLQPLAQNIFRFGLVSSLCGDSVMSFPDRRLLCVVALHSGFTTAQLVRLKELCGGNECLAELLNCLNEA
ncbi:huntingtin [Leptidea sinapis]|uniref:huntingtin n=1 Tax=Leptidea sinapis TaxID=189913 RepID=UPI002123C3A9|nr:huntingtin [Leptidea sinapis]